ncbi:MAG TPA: radical SAM protein [Elusimicrobia bacterium]|jgi:putative pyruvate formate lyase activating enzyme|nr:radical SAM protein [Elusimicrobiota bacterium]
MSEPAYLKLYKSKELNQRIDQLYAILKNCHLCPRKCQVDRTKNEKGICRSGIELVVSSIGPHFGEEEELVGQKGSGTIFLTNCNLCCLYCQNYEISHLGQGGIISPEELARGMLYLQKLGCHNINLVTPTHFVPQLAKTIKIACEMGLCLPIVFNCGGYEVVETIKLLDGIVDIYMPDIKYGETGPAEKYSNAPDYFEKCKEAVKEMYRQVGNLKIVNGIAERGMLIRHLVLPNNLAGSEKVLKFIAEEISPDTYVNIMDQYRPMYKAEKFSELNRRPHLSEYNHVIEIAENYGLHRGFQKRLILIT